MYSSERGEEKNLTILTILICGEERPLIRRTPERAGRRNVIFSRYGIRTVMRYEPSRPTPWRLFFLFWEWIYREPAKDDDLSISSASGALVCGKTPPDLCGSEDSATLS